MPAEERQKDQCEECKGHLEQCPYCGCGCELLSRTYYCDEDAFCDRCKQRCYQSMDGTLSKHPPGEQTKG